MSFPFYHHEVNVESRDLDLLGPLFSQSIQDVCPCDAVYFVDPSVSGDGLPTRWKVGVEVVRKSLQVVRDKGQKPALYLPLWSGENLFCVAVLIGVASETLELSSRYLYEKSKDISRELRQVKLAAIDPLTHLGNGLVLQSRLDALSRVEQATENSLLLFDFFPKAVDAGRAGASIAKMGASLHALIGHLAFLCHLGNGLFGLCWEGSSEETAVKMADQVLQWLKRDGLSRGHVGITLCTGGDSSGYFECAWQALVTARKRGPFGLCSYATVADRAAHPLSPPSVKIVRKLAKLMKGPREFALVELQPNDVVSKFSADLFEGSFDDVVPTGLGGGYVFLADMGEKEALDWCRAWQALFSKKKLQFSMGVAVYPFSKFRKGEMIGNCRKALLHTAFFGPGTCTIFDGVSLNISGDVYYNEGDMVKAAKEYRRGLLIDPENVNLLNSMGVTMAQMARYTKAIPYFQKVLNVDPRDFMALCNLGFSHVALLQIDQAIVAFEGGLSCNETHFDLLFQLGKIYSSQGRYTDAVRVLERAEQMGPENIEDVSHGAVHRFLGEAYYHEKKGSKGMASLQRAIRYNSRDALSLSLLGELYAESGEGLDIGLTFCLQAVEIDGECWEYHLRLARLYLACNQIDMAQKTMQQVLLLQRKHEDVFFMQAKLCEATDEPARACSYYQKVLGENAKHKAAGKALKRLRQSV